MNGTARSSARNPVDSHCARAADAARRQPSVAKETSERAPSLPDLASAAWLPPLLLGCSGHVAPHRGRHILPYADRPDVATRSRVTSHQPPAKRRFRTWRRSFFTIDLVACAGN